MAAQGVRREHSVGFSINAAVSRSFGDAFKKVEKQIAATKKQLRNTGKAWGDFGARVGRLGIGIVGGITAVTAAAYKMVDSVVSSADAVSSNAIRLRMGTDQYQKLAHAFNQAGMGADQFNGIMSRMDTSIVRATQSAQAMERFGIATGLDAEKLARLDPAQRIERIADYLNSLQDPLRRDQVAMELFGKSWAEMSGVLSQGSEGLRQAGQDFLRTGNLIDEATIEASQAYNKHRRHLQETISGIRTQLFSRLIPVFTNVFQNIADRLQSVNWDYWGAKISGWVTDAIPRMIELGQRIGEIAGRIWNGINAVREFVGGWRNLLIVIGILANFKTILSGAKAVMATGNAIMAAGNLVRGLFISKTAAATAAQVAQTTATVASTKAIAAKTVAIGALNFALGIGLIGVIVAVVAGIVWMIRNWDRVREVAGRVVGLITDRIRQFANWIRENFKSIALFIINPFAGVFHFLYNNFEGFRNFVDGIIGAIKGFFVGLWEDIKLRVDLVVAIFRLAWDKVKDGFQSLKDFIMRIFGPVVEFFKGIADTVGNIVGAVRNVGGGIRDRVGGFFGRSDDLPAHAEGGIFNRPHIAQIAEAGPEAVVPLENNSNARSIWQRAGQLAGFADTSAQGIHRINAPISVIVNVQGRADDSTISKLTDAGDSIARKVRDEMLKILPSALNEIARAKVRTEF